MSEYKNVTATKAANIYFEGKVTSRTLTFEDGATKTLGIMLPGDYEFGTEAAEIMEVLSGDLDVKLPGTEEWKTLGKGDTFNVPANSKFQLKVKTVFDYICSFIKE